MALLSQTPVRHDPVLAHNFVISLIDTSSKLGVLKSLSVSAIFDIALGGFTECSGLEMSMQPEEYKEGGRNGTVLKFPSRVTWSNITLKKGVGASTALWDWHYGFVEGQGRRRDGVIVLLNDLHVPNNIWYFRRGLPVRYTGPTMNAAQSNVAIEAIEIAHEGIYQVPFVGLGAAAVTTTAGLVV
jgi:phage tail-like protein